ncbi:hypothetical protein ACFOG5_23770 [Pedobacter fastidiosus]
MAIQLVGICNPVFCNEDLFQMELLWSNPLSKILPRKYGRHGKK